MKKKETLISIIMPVYNAEIYIYTSVESVIHQSHKDWELLIINDGSTDDTEEIIIGFKDSRIRYFSQKNKGVSNARNVGLKNMKGDFFCFLDADDFLPPGSLEHRYKKIYQNKKLDFVDGRTQIYNKNLNVQLNHWAPSFKGNPLNQLLKLNGTCFFGLTWMIKRNKDEDYRFHEDISHGEDLLFFIEVAKEGGNYDFVDEVILHYRTGQRSAMRNLMLLEKGYHQVYSIIKKFDCVTAKQSTEFRQKAISIIFKSYLGNYQLKNALLSLTKKW